MSNCFYQLPDLLAICPSKSVPPNIHAKAPEIQRHKNCGRRCSISWNLIACKNAKATIAVSFFFPNGDAKAFKAAVAYGKAGIILEKLTDAATVVDARKWATLYINAFDHVIQGTKAQHPFVRLINGIKAMHPFVLLIRSLAASANECLEDLYRKEFLDANSALAQGIVQEAVDRQAAQDANAKLTVDVYLATRRNTIGVKAALVLVRSARGLNICSRLLDDPSVRGMEEATTDLVIIANDIYSYKKELVDDNGAQHNLLTVLMQDPKWGHLDLQGAIDCAGQLFESAIARFKECRANLPSIDEETNMMLATYADTMVDTFVGNIEWSLICKRYSVFENEESRQKGLLSL
ncbi:isoprenoid synthase domain-containing protein [Hygrophoropsis aurantiaca]|uniref:Isoprenoid synthase domain-containing protein n=1 Tax=Hygrophoropsis aurantiaca TaxID=72124 RepID=A0ACB7ZTY6_9AGAM|nr:isoprenoid synthase domain-containing protein [Hygrophoropsis aurantiaca]